MGAMFLSCCVRRLASRADWVEIMGKHLESELGWPGSGSGSSLENGLAVQVWPWLL